MSHKDNQTVERYYFDLFQSHYDVPDGDLVFTDKPDVIACGAQTIGIEIANLYLSNGADPASEQVQCARRLKVLKQAQALHRGSDGIQIELSVGFNPKYPIHELKPVAQALAAIARKLEGSSSGQVSRILIGHVSELSTLYCDQNKYEDAVWRPVQGYGVPALSLDRLRALVAEKTTKLVNYQLCDFYWLLLVVDFMDPAQDQDLQWPTGEILESSPFERILLYKPQFGEIVQVPQRKPVRRSSGPQICFP